MMATALVVASGMALAAISCTADTTCLGTNDNDEITGTTGDDTIKAGAGNDAVVARGGEDKVFGQGGIDGPLDGGAGNDTLNGGPNDNTALEWLIGGRGNDTLVESPGIDRYIFGPGWGQDVITGNGDQPGFPADSDSLCFNCGTAVTAGVTVKLAEGTATDGTNTITWDPAVTFIEGAYSGGGADEITGSAHSDVVWSGWGADTIDVSGGDSDVINCGYHDPDVDTVTMDSGDFIVPGSCEGDTVDIAVSEAPVSEAQ